MLLPPIKLLPIKPQPIKPQPIKPQPTKPLLMLPLLMLEALDVESSVSEIFAIMRLPEQVAERDSDADTSMRPPTQEKAKETASVKNYAVRMSEPPHTPKNAMPPS